MKEDFERLNNERKVNVEKAFASHDGKDQFFLHVLDGFAHRYITDQKFSQAEIQVPANAQYQASNKLETMKRALELVSPEQKTDLVNAMKAAVGSGKPTTSFTIEINAKDLNSDGKGKVQSQCIVDWGFPEHDRSAAKMVERTFESEDWDHLRKHYPLMLDELCEIF